MLAFVLRVLIVCELFLYATLAVCIFRLSIAGAALCALAGVFVLRMGVSGLTFALSAYYGIPVAGLVWWRRLALFFGEYAAFAVNFVLISPFESVWMGPDHLPAGNSRPPALLIHGYGCSRAAWWYLRRRIEAAGWTVATISLEPLYTDIETYLPAISNRIDDVLSKTGATQLTLVGHSMGGLVARAWQREHGNAKICRLITLGTPHGGTELARFGPGPNARQMVPGNAWLEKLSRSEGDAPEFDVLTIYSEHDNYVMPQHNLVWPNVPSVVLDGIGHLAMLYSRRVERALLAALPTRVRETRGTGR